MTTLIDHAKRELELLGEEPEVVEGYLKVVQAFSDMNHSGASAGIASQVLKELFEYRNLTPLTDDPDEWFHHDYEMSGRPGGLWQNKRRSDAFSEDGGKTYYLSSGGRKAVFRTQSKVG